ncbi:MAG: peptidylprolyl isomerase [Flavobacteriaceae bacterium]|nr:peptidylprolyl isomerase [Flavobacteriaceae bacterium]
MAVLSKIRERSVFLIIIIALALFSFVLSGIFDANSPLFNKNVNDIGGVDGDPITREEFAQEVDLIRARSNGRSNEMQNVDIAWNNLVLTKLYKSQLEKSGVIVGEKDIWDAIVSQVQLQNSPAFQNEAGLFDEEKLKEYVATLKENATNSDEDKMAWLGWLNYEKNIKSSIEQNTYNSLINAGLNSTTKESERDYFYKNTNVDIDYVYVPYASIADSLINITNDEIKNYIKERPKQFTSEPSRDIQFVHFTVQPSIEDENEIKAELGALLNNKEEYSTAAKANVTVTGFSETDNLADFFGTNSSDLPLDKNYYTRASISKILADTLFNKPIGTVYGPYKEAGFYKISKVTAVKQLPDSVKASHILIPFVGAATADVSTVRTPEEAKVFADSISNLVSSDKTKFDQLARDISVDRSSAENGGDLGWFAYTTMIPEFRDYVFENKVGDVGVVKTQFGYHIIRIDGQKNPPVLCADCNLWKENNSFRKNGKRIV